MIELPDSMHGITKFSKTECIIKNIIYNKEKAADQREMIIKKNWLTACYGY